MRRFIYESKKEKIKGHVEVICLILTLTLITLSMIFSFFDRYEIEESQREEYIQVFKESKIDELLGLDGNKGEGVVE